MKNSSQMYQEDIFMQNKQNDDAVTQKVKAVKQNPTELKAIDAPTRPLLSAQPAAPNRETGLITPREVPGKPVPRPVSTPGIDLGKGKQAAPLTKRDAALLYVFQERCRQLSLSLFFQESASVRSLGFTSAISGEGKSFLSMVMASVLAGDSGCPVTLLECNWENPSMHEYYGFPAAPGAAEWLRRECRPEDIRYRVEQNLTVIPAGNGCRDAVRLVQQMRQQGLRKLFAPQDELLIVDLPAVVTTAYGQMAASLLDSVLLVVHAGVTPNTLIEETCSRLKDVPVQGIILNQLQSKIPRWIRQVL